MHSRKCDCPNDVTNMKITHKEKVVLVETPLVVTAFFED